MTDTIVKGRRGFASMDPERLRQISSKGGHTAQQKGSAHRWTREEARHAGRKGGRASRRPPSSCEPSYVDVVAQASNG
jgi:general stress protein YciG